MPVKKRGRPSVDSDRVEVRFERTALDAIDQWRAGEPDAPSRPEAIRRLVQKALGEGNAQQWADARQRALKYLDEMTDEEDGRITVAARSDPDNPPLDLRRKR